MDFYRIVVTDTSKNWLTIFNQEKDVSETYNENTFYVLNRIDIQAINKFNKKYGRTLLKVVKV